MENFNLLTKFCKKFMEPVESCDFHKFTKVTFAKLSHIYVNVVFVTNAEIQQRNSPLNGEISITVLQSFVKHINFPIHLFKNYENE